MGRARGLAIRLKRELWRMISRRSLFGPSIPMRVWTIQHEPRKYCEEINGGSRNVYRIEPEGTTGPKATWIWA